MSSIEVDEDAVLRLYGLSTLDPQRWEAVEGDDVANIELQGAGVTEDAGGRSREIEDPLGLYKTLKIPPTMDMKTLAPTLLSSKNFSATEFLSLWHPDASFQDLRHATQHLRRGVEERGVEVKVLVEKEFGRFVSVKGTTDAVSSDMRADFLADGTDHGTREVREAVKVTSHKAETIYLPLLSNALKAQRLRSTLGVFERSQWLFALPRNLRDLARAGNYTAALREYNKAKNLLHTRPSQLLPISLGSQLGGLASPIDGQSMPAAALSAEQVAARRQQQQRIFKRIFDEADRVVDCIRVELEETLSSELGAERAVEDVEKSIEILDGLGGSEDPAWIFLYSQQEHITKRLQAIYTQEALRVEEAKAKLNRPDDVAIVDNLRSCVQSIYQDDVAIDRTRGYQVWEAHIALVSKLCAYILRTLPSYWKICRGFIDGKYKSSRTRTTTRRSPAQIRQLAVDIGRRYISLIGQHFTLSDMSIAMSPGKQSETPSMDFVPSGSTSITAAHFLKKILAEISDCVEELEGVGAASDQVGSSSSSKSQTDLKSALDTMVTNCRWRATEVVCALWSSDAKQFFALEKWEINPGEPDTTLYLVQANALQRSNASAVFQLAGGSARSREPLPSPFVSRINASFFDTLYFILDGLVHLAFAQPVKSGTPSAARSFDPSDDEARILLTISNLGHMKSTILPKLIDRFSSLFGADTSTDRQTLWEVTDQLDKILFDDVVKRKTCCLAGICERALIEDMAWTRGDRPTEIRPYLYKCLLHLVDVHAQTNDISPSLVRRVMQAAFVQLAQALLASFEKVDTLSQGGMLVGTLEIEFCNQALHAYETEESTAKLNSIYVVIRRAYPGREDNMTEELEALKRILLEARRATKNEFLCFRASQPQQV